MFLSPTPPRVEQRFNLWIGRQLKAGRNFTEEQMNWLKPSRIILPQTSRSNPPTSCGAELNGMLDELSEALAA
jgi:type I restriction enzyme R subunit